MMRQRNNLFPARIYNYSLDTRPEMLRSCRFLAAEINRNEHTSNAEREEVLVWIW